MVKGGACLTFRFPLCLLTVALSRVGPDVLRYPDRAIRTLTRVLRDPVELPTVFGCGHRYRPGESPVGVFTDRGTTIACHLSGPPSTLGLSRLERGDNPRRAEQAPPETRWGLFLGL